MDKGFGNHVPIKPKYLKQDSAWGAWMAQSGEHLISCCAHFGSTYSKIGVIMGS